MNWWVFKNANILPHTKVLWISYIVWRQRNISYFPDSTFFLEDEKILIEINNKDNVLFYSQNYFSTLFGVSHDDIVDVMENEIKTINKWKNLFVIEYDFFIIEEMVKYYDD